MSPIKPCPQVQFHRTTTARIISWTSIRKTRTKQQLLLLHLDIATYCNYTFLTHRAHSLLLSFRQITGPTPYRTGVTTRKTLTTLNALSKLIWTESCFFLKRVKKARDWGTVSGLVFTTLTALLQLPDYIMAPTWTVEVKQGNSVF